MAHVHTQYINTLHINRVNSWRKVSTITQKLHGHYMVIMAGGCIQSVTTSLLSVEEDKGDLLHREL